MMKCVYSGHWLDRFYVTRKYIHDLCSPCSDYQGMDALDRYDAAGLDDRDFDALDPEARRAAEAALEARDRREGRGRSRIAAVMESDEEEETDEGFRRAQRRRQRLEQTASAGEEAAEDAVRGQEASGS